MGGVKGTKYLLKTRNHAPRTTRHAPRTTHHAPRTTHHAPRTTHHAQRKTKNSVPPLFFEKVGDKNRGARFCQVCRDSLESSGSIKYSLPKPDIPTGGRLYHFRQAWQNITTDQWTQSVIRSGFRIQFRVRPKLARVVPQFLRKPPADPEKIRLLQEEIESMLEKRAIEPVS